MRKKQLLFRSCLFAVSLCLVNSSLLLAQFTLTGTVTDQSNEPLIGVTVVVQNTTIGTTTNAEGKYSINLPSNRAKLRFSFIGFKTKIFEISNATPILNVTLEPDILGLEELVISGLGSTMKRTNLANSIEAITAEELTGMTVSATLDGALSGKVTGATINSNSGAPGGGYSINLRGVTTINGSSQPLFIVDGVFISNSAISNGANAITAAAAGGNASNQDNPVNRVADINPEDIANIEILKGASAAAIYGARASNGVVVITTKKGSQGATEFNLKQEVGWTSIIKPLGSREFTRSSAVDAFGASGGTLFDEATSSGRGFIDYEDLLYGNVGMLAQTSLSASGGDANTRFFISGLYKDDEGIVTGTGYEKQSVKLNLDHDFSQDFKVKLNANYIHSMTDRGLTGNDNTGNTFGVALSATPNFVDLRERADGTYPNHPFNPSNPIQTANLLTNRETVNRFLLSGRAELRLLQTNNQNLQWITEGGADFFSQGNYINSPRELQLEQVTQQPGTLIYGFTDNLNTNIRSLFIHTYIASTRDLTLTSQAGYTSSNVDRNTLINTAQDVGAGQINLLNAASVTSQQNLVFQRTRGFFVQEDLNMADQFIVTGSIRGEKSDANGDVEKLYYFPRGAIAWNATNMDFWNFDTINSLKLRFAVGQTGNLPLFGAKSTILDPINIGGNSGLVVNNTRGLADIKPEIQTEYETGFDIAAFDGKASLEFTVYRKVINDLLLFRSPPPSSGFILESFNAGELQNEGMEVSLTLFPVRQSNLEWLSRINFWTLRSEVTDLPVPSFNVGGFGQTLGVYRIEEGKSATQIIGIDGFDANDDVIVTKLGDFNPDFQLSFYNDFKIAKNFSFSFLAHWKKGGDVINLTELLTDLSGTTADYDDTDYKVIQRLVDDAGIQPGDNNATKRLKLLGVSARPYVQDASYFRIRDIGLYYTVPESTLDQFFGLGSPVSRIKVGASAKNILTLTPYSSYDPEVSNFGSQAIANGIEVTPFPSSKQFYLTLSVDF